MTVVGARPQFIKAAPLSRALAAADDMTEVLVHTGQHYDYNLSQQFFDELGLPTPQYNLGVGSARHVVQMSEIMRRLDDVLLVEKPDLVIVFGDTNSTAAAAIAAAKNHIPLAHVEAGLREFDRTKPEEINKMLTDSVTDLYFPPTKTGVENLRRQGIERNVFLTGDIGIDLIINDLDRIEKNKSLLDKLNVVEKSYYFMTCHRAENTDNLANLKQIVSALDSLDVPIIFPMHPRTRATIEQNNLQYLLEKPNLKIIEPIGFWDTQTLIRNAKMVLTDSGGVVKEAYFHRVRCVILQDQIEWVEAVEEGWARLAGNKTVEILSKISTFDTPSVWSGFLGDGRAAERIVAAIRQFFQSNA